MSSKEGIARTLARVTPGDRVRAETEFTTYEAVATDTVSNESGVRVTVVPEDGDDWLELRAARELDTWRRPAVYRLQYPDDTWTELGTLTALDVDTD